MKLLKLSSILPTLPAAALLASCSSHPAIEPREFASPEEAARALVASVEKGARPEVMAVLGSDAEEVIDSGDPVADASARTWFLDRYREKNHLERVSESEAVLHVGTGDWPFPIPIARTDGGGWVFDTAAGKEEILDRRIGKNELDAIQTCLAIVDAQQEYARVDRDGDGLHAYAEMFLSTPGKRDGLFWESGVGEPASPLGPLVAEAASEGYGLQSGKREPYHGYFYRILKAQGPDAAGGAYDYVVHGTLIGGFAVVAYPAEYGSSGIMTFLTNHDGVIFQKDLGDDTAAAAEKLAVFNPDATWSKVASSEVGE
jgi:hypothetical protein